jgi:hypothetical protein
LVNAAESALNTYSNDQSAVAADQAKLASLQAQVATDQATAQVDGAVAYTAITQAIGALQTVQAGIPQPVAATPAAS